MLADKVEHIKGQESVGLCLDEEIVWGQQLVPDNLQFASVKYIVEIRAVFSSGKDDNIVHY